MTADNHTEPVPAKGGLQWAVGIARMVRIANLHYGWAYFVNPIGGANLRPG